MPWYGAKRLLDGPSTKIDQSGAGRAKKAHCGDSTVASPCSLRCSPLGSWRRCGMLTGSNRAVAREVQRWITTLSRHWGLVVAAGTQAT